MFFLIENNIHNSNDFTDPLIKYRVQQILSVSA